MSESEQSNKDNYRIIIYHGHIHILSKDEKNKENDDLSKIRNPI